MQYATAQPRIDYNDLKSSQQPVQGSLEVQSGGSWKRILKYLAGFVVLVSLVLATFSLLSFLLAQHFYLEIQSECYGRYEMCMEMSWKGNVDHKPSPKDHYFVPLEKMQSDDIQNVVSSNGDSWWTLCQPYVDSDLRQLTDDAPWYCTCMQELFFRCNRVDDTPEELKTEILNFDTTEIVGFHARSDFLDRNWEILKLSIWTQIPALILFVVGLVAYVLVIVPWKRLAVKPCEWVARFQGSADTNGRTLL